jgi:dsDNA-binding SOS-regulon protein
MEKDDGSVEADATPLMLAMADAFAAVLAQAAMRHGLDRAALALTLRHAPLATENGSARFLAGQVMVLTARRLEAATPPASH